MSLHTVSERISFIQKLTPVQNYQPEIGWNITWNGFSSGSLIYHGYCLGTNSSLPNGGWWGAALSLAMTVTGTFNIIRARQHQTAKTISLDDGTLNAEKSEAAYDPFLEASNAVEELFNRIKIEVGPSAKNETSQQKTLRLLESFEQSYQALEKANIETNKDKNVLKTRISELDQQLQEKLKTTQIQDSMIEMKQTNAQQIEELRAELLEAQERIMEHEEAAESTDILIEMYKTQLERLELLLQTSSSSNLGSPSHKDMEEARSIVSNLKQKSAESSRRSSTTGTPKSNRSSPDSTKNLMVMTQRKIFTGELSLSPKKSEQ